VPRTSLRPHPTSAAAARRFVADVLLNRGFGEGCIEQAVLATSEVVTGAVHTGTEVDVVVVADHPMVRVEVYGDEAVSHRSHHHDVAAALRCALIDALAEAWGVDQVGSRRKRTWFEMRS
jgi:hypothetical protein